jgi:hypothetical protein
LLLICKALLNHRAPRSPMQFPLKVKKKQNKARI